MSSLELIGSIIFVATSILIFVGPYFAVRTFRVMRGVVYFLGGVFLLFGLFTWFLLRPWDLDNTTHDFWNAVPLLIGLLCLLTARLTKGFNTKTTRYPKEDSINNVSVKRQFVPCHCPACCKVVKVQKNGPGQANLCPACGQTVVMDTMKPPGHAY